MLHPTPNRPFPAIGADPALSPHFPPALAAIQASDLRRDLFTLADDAFRGREAGTLDELRAAAWLAERARAAGLEPAGEAGSFFQFFSLQRLRTATSSRVLLDAQPLVLGRDAVVWAPAEARVAAPFIWLDSPSAGGDVTGCAVALELCPPAVLPPASLRLREIHHTVNAITDHARTLVARGAAAILFVCDDVGDRQWPLLSGSLARGRFGVTATDVEKPCADPPVLWVARALGPRLRELGTREARATFEAVLGTERYEYPSVNVVARVPGREPALRDECVLFSAHHDHDGVRPARDGTDDDKVWNGADDNASGSVALLAIGRAFAQAPGARAALFVWHGAEERGLLGARWYAAHPTVPLTSITAVLNADMLGRNGAEHAALLGVHPAHCNSPELVQQALDANARTTRFMVDTSWDDPAHPEGWYFRGDHVPYARAGVPALFFSSLLHEDYHTPRDTAWAIDYAKLARMAQWMYATGWAVASASARPRIREGFRLES